MRWSMTPVVKCLPSGWILIRFSHQCWAQVPPGWKGHIPDEYIFDPDSNRERINEWAENNSKEEIHDSN